ncbi:MAG: multidrug effflux MFS transporter [Campylobacteraceae bacterium]
MRSLSISGLIVVLILALLTALEPLSIDTYLPGFIIMADALKTDVASIQISLATFLGGFAVGQLIWGPLADKLGRKKPILISLFIFVVASIGCMFVTSVEALWVLRFVQAVGGCGGIVISRAIVTDYFDKSLTLKIYSLLAMIVGVAPIIAPVFGNLILSFAKKWEMLFLAMATLGVILFVLTLFFLPETKNFSLNSQKKESMFASYFEILKVRKFLTYSIIAGIINGALMIYVSNGPFLIMEKAGYSGGMFSLIFATNALGLMFGSYLVSVLSKYIIPTDIVKKSLFSMVVVGIIMYLVMIFTSSMNLVLVILFIYLIFVGILFPVTTELAITPFIKNSGSASSLFGTIQMTLAFLITLVSGLISNGTVSILGIEFTVCIIFSLACLLIKKDVIKS